MTLNRCYTLLLGLQWGDIAACVKWMAAFVYVVREEGQTQVTAAVRQGTATSDTSSGSGLLKSMPHVVVDDSHNIQTHVVDLQMLVSIASHHLDVETCKHGVFKCIKSLCPSCIPEKVVINRKGIHKKCCSLDK